MTNNKEIIEHHTKYLEIDGYDEVIHISRSEHAAIHRKLLKNGIRVNSVIVQAAHDRNERKKIIVRTIKQITSNN